MGRPGEHIRRGARRLNIISCIKNGGVLDMGTYLNALKTRHSSEDLSFVLY